MTKSPALILAVNGRHGVYVPKVFLENYSGICQGLADQDAILSGDPESCEYCEYWEAWDSILSNFTYVNDEGDTYTLYQDDDLWLVCEARLTPEEYFNLFGVEQD